MGRVVTTPLEKPMSDVLVAYLCKKAEGNPFAMADMLVLVPNRRSCIALKERFALLAGEQTLILPNIQPLGEVDEDALMMGGLLHDAGLVAALAAIPPAVSATERLVAVAAEIHANRVRFGIDPLNMEQAGRLAQELCTFMDELARDGIDPQVVLALRAERYSEHWQKSLMLLKHVLGWWPKWLAAHGRIGVVERRNRLLELLAAHWLQHPPATPVIVAGSTGTQPATAALLKVVAGLPQGEVIVPGLDMYATAEMWAAVDASHPQYWLKQLLATLQLSADNVTLLDDESVAGGPYARARALLEACRPASLAADWERNADQPHVTEGLVRIDCQHEWEEAQLVSLLLRETLEQPQKTAALVTHDKALARRVTALMKRYDVVLDSASGEPLTSQPYWQFFHSLSFAASQRQMPVALLALLKHPLCPLLENATQRDALVGKLERYYFRGLRRASDVLGQLNSFARSDRISEDERDALMALYHALAPLYQAFSSVQSKAEWLLKAHRNCMDALVTPDADATEVMESLALGMQHSHAVSPATYHAMLAQCLMMHKWWPNKGGHPRLHILSPMEARMLPVDRLILGGMNEGTWPHDVSEDAWLNESMRQAIGLPPRAARQGQEAHDWLMLASQPEVFMTRARRAGGADTLASRWLERLDAYLGYGKDERAAYQASPYLEWVRERTYVDENAPCLPPAPRPPIEALPRQWSVTGMEQLLQNPYGAYARYVLELKPLREIDEALSSQTLGQALHKVFERFVNAVNADASQLNEACLETIIASVLQEYAESPQMVLFWQPRIAQIVPWMVQIERERRLQAKKVMAEQDREAAFAVEGESVNLTARIDRMEWNAEGWRLIDYKSGKAPQPKNIRLGYACQLPFAALIMAQDDGSLSQGLEYWELGSGYRKPVVRSLDDKEHSHDALLDLYRDGLLQTIERYYVQGRAYYAIPVPAMRPHFDDYAHLARIKEWLGAA